MKDYIVVSEVILAAYSAEKKTGPVRALYFLRVKIGSIARLMADTLKPDRKPDEMFYSFTWRTSKIIKTRAIKVLFENLSEDSIQEV